LLWGWSWRLRTSMAATLEDPAPAEAVS
jgi:hypothetical protein